MKRKREQFRQNPSYQGTSNMRGSKYNGDPKLLGRVKQYLQSKNKPVVSIPLMAQELQAQYRDYTRMKRLIFQKSVERAYEQVCSQGNKDGKDHSSFEESYLKKKKRRKDDSDVSDEDDDDDDDKSFSSDNGDYTLHTDSNSMNSFMTSMYKKTPGKLDNSLASGSSTPTAAPVTPKKGPNSTSTPAGSSSIQKQMRNSKTPGKGEKPSQNPHEDSQMKLSKDEDLFVSNDCEVLGYFDKSGSKIPDLESRGSMSALRGKIQDGGKRLAESRADSGTETPLSTKSLRKTKRKQSSQEDKQESKKKKGTEVQTSSITFANIGGSDAVLKDICKLLVHMRHPEVYQTLGVTPPRGFLLHGPPGCGKTLLAHAIAGEFELPFIKLAATEVVSGVSGESEEKIRDLFDKAEASAPCILFIDEIDAITPKRETASKDMERRIVTQLLTCMDDLNSKDTAHVLVIGATNRPDSIDPALRRAGRFDREICLGIPDEQARLRILQVICKDLKLPADFDFLHLARNTPGYVGADLSALAREAAITAVNRIFQDLEMSRMRAERQSVSSEKVAEPMDVQVVEKEVEGKAVTCISPKIPSAGDPSILIEDSPPSHMVANDEKVGPVESNSPPSELGANHGKAENDSLTPETIRQDDSDRTKMTIDDPQISSRTPDMDLASKQVDETDQPNPNALLKRPEENEGQGVSTSLKEQLKSWESAPVSQTGHQEELEATDSLQSILSWMKDLPPLSEQQLQNLCIDMDDFKEALKHIQPSAKREGFATIPDVTWNDIGALHDIRDELQMAILAPVRRPEQFKSLGLTTPPGILLAGPPGCGKTLLAKAVANESGINFISVKGPELLNMYVGESERAVRQVFQRGRNSAPCVIFFDELDALCPRRSDTREGGSSVRVVNQLLTEMDGLEERKQVFIMGATNRPDIIDPAVMRPGRLDKVLYVGLPSQPDRLDILKTITKNGTKPAMADDVDLTAVSSDVQCEGFTGADLAALVREAAVMALREFITSETSDTTKPVIVHKQHFDTAFSKVRPSVAQKDKAIYENLKKRLALR